jgi:hypothetical protein
MLKEALATLCKSLAPGLLLETRSRESLERLISKEFPSGNSLSYAALVIVERVLDRAVQLVVLGHTAAVYVELHAALERYVITALPRAVGKNDVAARVVAELIDRRTLSDLAPHMVAIGRWAPDDLPFVRRLAQLRNAVAHRNENALRKLVGGDPMSYRDEPFDRLKRVDATVDLVETLKLMIKATRFRRRSRKPAKNEAS